MKTSISLDIQSSINFFRDQILSEIDYKKAVSIIKSSFDNMTSDIANSILSADKTISSEFDLIDEDTNFKENFINEVNYIYKNYIEYNNSYYKVYAIVTDLGVFDFVSNKSQIELFNEYFDVHYDSNFDFSEIEKSIIENFDVSNLNKSMEERALHYASNKNDYAIPFNYNGNTYFFLCNNKINLIPPFAKKSTMIDVFNIINKSSETSNRGHFSYMKHGISNRKFFNKFMVEDIKKQVLYKNEGYGLIDFYDENEKLIFSAPKLPFLHWSLKDTNAINSIDKYSPISHIGLKMNNDDPIHSDWFVAAGLDLDGDDYSIDSIVSKLSYQKKHEIQESFIDDLQYTIINSANKDIVSGKIIICTPENYSEVEPGDILIIPNDSVDFEKHFFAATINNHNTAIISVIGSKAAHMTIVCREFNVPMLYIPNAIEFLFNGLNVSINFKNGSVHF